VYILTHVLNVSNFLRVWNRERKHTYTRIRKKGCNRKRKQSRYASFFLAHTHLYTHSRIHAHAPVKTIHFKFPLSINFQNYFSPLQNSAYVKSCFKSTWCKKLHQFCLVISESLLFYIFFSTSLASAPPGRFHQHTRTAFFEHRMRGLFLAHSVWQMANKLAKSVPI